MGVFSFKNMDKDVNILKKKGVKRAVFILLFSLFLECDFLFLAGKEQVRAAVKFSLSDFNKKIYECDGFNLIVFNKSGQKILYYVDTITGAQFLVTLKNAKDGGNSTVFFGCPSQDDKGIVHGLEHCIATPIVDRLLERYKVITKREFNGITNEYGFYITMNQTFFNDETLKYIFEELKEPDLLTDKKLFQKEVINRNSGVFAGRQFNEVLTNYCSEKNFEKMTLDNIRNFDHGGTPKGVAQIRRKDVIEYYKKYVHPSNMLVSFSCDDAQEIKHKLNLFRQEYLSKYSRKNINLNYHLRVDDNNKFLAKKLGKDFKIFRYENKDESFSSDFVCEVCFDVSNLSLEKKDALFASTNLFDALIKDEIVELGYNSIELDYNEILKGRFVLKFYTNRREKTDRNTLTENAKKVLDIFTQKMQRDLKNQYIIGLREVLYNQSNVLVGGSLPNSYFKKADKYRKIYDMTDLCFYSFVKYKTPFSRNVFKIEDGEIKDDENVIKEGITENIEGIFNDVLNCNIMYINSFEKSDEPVKNKYLNSRKGINDENLLPIKITEYKDYFVFRIAEYLILRNILNPKIRERGLAYKNIENASYAGSFFKDDENIKSHNNMARFFKKELPKYIEDFQMNKQWFREIVADYKANLKRDIEYCVAVLKFLKSTGNSLLELKNTSGVTYFLSSMLHEINKNLDCIDVLFQKKEDYMNYRKNEDKFKEYFNKWFKDGNKKYDKESFAVNILKYINHKIDLLNYLVQEMEARFKTADFLDYRDVYDAIKSVRILNSKEKK